MSFKNNNTSGNGLFSFRKKLSSSLLMLLGFGALLISVPTFADKLLGLPPSEKPKAALVELGKALFFDRNLSVDGTVSCASCHRPDKAFTDGLPTAKGVQSKLGTRNTPSLWNVVFQKTLFWDGRRNSLLGQAADPLFNPLEHGFSGQEELLAVVRANTGYQGLFFRAYTVHAAGIKLEHLTTALAAFEETLLLGNSPADRFLFNEQENALSESAKRGLALFRGRAQCSTCHLISKSDALLTDNQFHSLGVGLQSVESRLARMAVEIANMSIEDIDRLVTSDSGAAQLGRFVVTKKPFDIGKFKTPSLRNVELTAPYMHDGSLRTLEDALDYEIYYRSGQQGRVLILTPQEKKDLLSFLKALTSEGAQSSIAEE